MGALGFSSSKIMLGIVAFCAIVSGFIFLPGATPQAAAATCSAAGSFITTWDTTRAGVTTNTQVRIPTTGTGYSYRVDINGDGDYADTVGTWNETTNRTGTVTIDFGTPGTYTIQICGTFPRIFFNNVTASDKAKLLRVDQWGDNAWTSMQGAFYGANNLDVVAADTPNLSAVTTTRFMFRGASSLVGTSAFNSWNVSTIQDFGHMFYGATSFNQPLNNWNTSAATILTYMFYGATSFNQPLNNWNVSNVTDMSYMFRFAPSFNQPLNAWNIGNVTTTLSMFYGATSFNQPLNNWNTANVTNMTEMFREARAFNQPIGNWNVGQVTRMRVMFQGARAFNQPLNNWNVGLVDTMRNMFRGASSFNQPLNNWDTKSVTDFGFMFGGFTNENIDATTTDISMVPMVFNQDISMWNTGAATDMSGMFLSDTSKVIEYFTNAGYTTINIADTTSYGNPFNHPLGTWDIADVTTMDYMFDGASLSRQNYDATLNGWNVQTVQPNVRLGALGLTYCSAAPARQNLSTAHSWVITGDTQDCSLLPVAPDSNATSGVVPAVSAPSSGLVGVPNNLILLALTGASIGLLLSWRYRRVVLQRILQK